MHDKAIDSWPRPSLAGYSRPMAEDADIEALAARYLDLWERQAAAAAGEPELAQRMLHWIAREFQTAPGAEGPSRDDVS